MISIEIKENCNGCYACANSCPKGCIKMISDEEGFWYPKVDKKQCVSCGKCVNACPILTEGKKVKCESAYAAMHTDDGIRWESSSGGVFSAIAEYVLEHNGAVFGAAFNKRFEVEHRYVERKEDLAGLRGSKYVQSRTGDTFKQAKVMLDKGRIVLYTGTPCQIAGLLKYLGKEYENLYTQDLICHGVPSPLAFEKYIDCRKKDSSSNVVKVSFRDKKNGWEESSFKIEFENYETYIGKQGDDLYRHAFLGNLILRPSCYQCSFKDGNRCSDITLADFWGIKDVLPDLYDKSGVSLVACNTNKGEILLKRVEKKIKIKEVDYKKALPYNMSAIKSARRPGSRDFFFCYLKQNSFDKTVEFFLNEKNQRRIQFWEDKESVEKEKGKFFAFLWAIMNKKNYK